MPPFIPFKSPQISLELLVSVIQMCLRPSGYLFVEKNGDALGQLTRRMKLELIDDPGLKYETK